MSLSLSLLILCCVDAAVDAAGAAGAEKKFSIKYERTAAGRDGRPGEYVRVPDAAGGITYVRTPGPAYVRVRDAAGESPDESVDAAGESPGESEESLDAAGISPDESEESVDEEEQCTVCQKFAEYACEICGLKCEKCNPDMRTDLLDGNMYCDECGPEQTNAASKYYDNALDCDAKGVSTSLYVYRKLC